MSFLQELQKYDLHCHLDGSLSVDCIRTMAEQAGISLEEKNLKERLLADFNCKSLAEYLTKFDLPLECLVTEENFTEAVKDVMKTAAAERVIYIEIRFATHAFCERRAVSSPDYRRSSKRIEAGGRSI